MNNNGIYHNANLDASALETYDMRMAKSMSNREIAKIFYEISVYLDMDNVPFRPRAYEKVAETIDGYDRELADAYKEGGRKALEAIDGVGVAIADKIEEMLKTGKLDYYEKLKKQIPVDISGLRTVEGVGPKAIKALWETLRIKNLVDLEKAARAGKIRTLPRFGIKSEEKILKSLAAAKRHAGRFPIHNVLPLARKIEARLAALPQVQRIVIGGSLRRWKETIGDVDLLAISNDPAPVMKAFVTMPEIANVIAHGETKSMITLKNGLDVDLRVVPLRSFGAALNYFTGSKAHNVALRERAITKRWKLNEYGLYKGARQIAGATEEDLYAKLGLAYIPPELREDKGALASAFANRIPHLLELSDIRGDLQVQTAWTDGKHPIEEMALAAIERGWEYLLITDHSKYLTVTGGLDEKRIKRQWKEIDRLNAVFRRKKITFTILRGTECDIRKDGALDFPDDILAACDIVGISVHGFTHLPKTEQTERIIRAMENPHADILLHPTGRIVGKREAFDVDMDAVIAAAKRTHTIMEVNGSNRLDLKDEYAAKALAVGVRLAVSTDAHAKEHFAWMEYGVHTARRGWATKKDVVNTMPLKDLLAYFRTPKKNRR